MDLYFLIHHLSNKQKNIIHEPRREHVSIELILSASRHQKLTFRKYFLVGIACRCVKKKSHFGFFYFVYSITSFESLPWNLMYICDIKSQLLSADGLHATRWNWTKSALVRILIGEYDIFKQTTYIIVIAWTNSREFMSGHLFWGEGIA